MDLQRILDASPFGAYMVNRSHQVVYANPVLTKNCGAADGRSCHEYFNGLQGACPWRDDSLGQCRKEPRWQWQHPEENCTFEAFDIPTPASQELLRIGFLFDCNQQGLSRKELELSRQVLDVILDNSLAVIYVKDLEGRYLITNKRHQELFQCGEKQMSENTPYDIYTPELASRLLDNDRQVAQSRQAIQIEETVQQAGQERTYISVKSPVVNDRNEVFAVAGISTDITALKEAEVAVRRERQELQQALEQLERKKREVDEINTALNVLLERYRMAGQEIEERVAAHLHGLVFPHIEMLQPLLHGRSAELLAEITDQLTRALHSFSLRLDAPHLGLTKREILLAELIRKGRRSQEIALLLGLAERSIESYRNNLRKKLGISGNKVNLQLYLQKNFPLD